MTDAELFLQVMSEVYTEMRRKMKTYCKLTEQDFDDDVYSNTLLKCYDTINKQGSLNDTSKQGIMNYFFKSFLVNLKRDKLYAREKKRDSNSALSEQYEDYLERTTTAPDEKILSDTRKDFTVFYLMLKAQENFDDEHFHLFNMKSLGNLTYKQLQQMTNAKAIRQKVSNVKKWLRENITKEEVDEAFNAFLANNMFI